MVDTWTLLLEEYEQHRGELCIPHGLEVHKLVGLEDHPDDYYWVTCDFFGKKQYLSCVGTPIWLKGCIDDNGYNGLMCSFKVHPTEDVDPLIREK